MSVRKRYRVKHKNKPMFKTKRKRGSSVLGIILMVIVFCALVFVGYSAGKPIVEFISGTRDKTVNADASDTTVTATTPAPETSATEITTEEEPEEDIPTESDGSIYFISYDGETANYGLYVSEAVAYAARSGYSGVCIELVAEGGVVLYATENETAIGAGAVVENCISSLSDLVSQIESNGLTAYARVSILSDNIASWYDKSLSFMISGSDSRWLDNNTASGGKPWISPFSSTAAEYIGGLAREISEAGFSGLLAGEVEYPYMRSSDLKLIGSSVQDSDRYKALAEFAENIFNYFGSAKEFYIDVDALDVISGDAEILTDSALLCTSTIYVSFNPDDFTERITRSDGTIVSFEGLEGTYLFRTVFSLVEETLDGTGITVIPKISGMDLTDELVSAIELLGYDPAEVIIGNGE